MTTRQTEAAVLDVAQELVQTRGYNAFSFRDLAERIGIKAASIHYYFPSKADLCRALLGRYRRQYGTLLAGIDEGTKDAKRKLKRYAQLFHDTLETENRMCLCGMLASDVTTLPPAVRDELRGFFDDNQVWLTRVLAEGREAGKLHFTGTAEMEARLIVSGLEGAMLVARLYEDPALLESMTRRLLAKYQTM